MKKYQRILTLLLALCLTVGLFAGCGKENDDPKQTDDPAQPTETPEYTYVPSYISLNDSFENGFDSVTVVGDKLLVSSYERVEVPATGGEPDGDGDTVMPLDGEELPDNAVASPEEETFDEWRYEEVYYWLSLDGTATKIEGMKSMEIPEGFDPDSTSVWTANVSVMDDGSIVTLEQVYAQIYKGPDGVEKYTDEWWNNVETREMYFIRKMDNAGNEVQRLDLTEITDRYAAEQGYFYLNSLTVGADGNFYLQTDGGVLVVSPEGEELYMVGLENGWINSMFRTSDGKVHVVYYDESAASASGSDLTTKDVPSATPARSGGYVLATIDAATKSLTGARPAGNAGNYNLVAGGGDYDAYYTNGSNFYGFNFETGESTKILNWINCDVDTRYMGTRNIGVLDDGRIIGIENRWYNVGETGGRSETNLVILEKQPYSSLPQRTRITYASQYLQYNTRSAIIDFNRSSGEYRIEVQDYSEYNTEEDYSAGLTKLKTEIMSGKVPDIIDLNGLPLDELASKGILADLYTFIDSDSELSRDSLFQSVLTALESDGKLYRTASSFAIQTVLGAPGVVGDEPGWTLEEFNAALAKMPEGCTPFSESTTRGDVLQGMITLELGDLVNWSTGECKFNSKTFTDILEFAAQFPETFDYENYNWPDETDRIASGQQMLMTMYLSDFESSRMYAAIFGGDVTYIGYPVSEGVGNMLQIDDSGLAISAKSANQDAAWQFVRKFFTEKYQTENVYSFPTNKAAFNAKLKTAMTPIWQTDENGKYILDENGNKIEQSQGTWGWGNITVEMYALTQEEADSIVDVINATTRVYSYDEDIMDIITSEAAAFFAGQKSADEVAKLVQSKANIKVNERR